MSLVVNFLTNPNTANFVQNSSLQVISEGCLKAIGRPAFTLLDKTAGEKEKKYSASRELIYQSLSIFSYFALIFPIRKNTFRLLKHFPQLKDCDAVYAKTSEEFKNKLKTLKDSEVKTKIGGAQELMSIIASGIILAVIAPRIVNKIIHPVMQKLDLEKKDEQKNTNVDIKI